MSLSKGQIWTQTCTQSEHYEEVKAEIREILPQAMEHQAGGEPSELDRRHATDSVLHPSKETNPITP